MTLLRTSLTFSLMLALGVSVWSVHDAEAFYEGQETMTEDRTYEVRTNIVYGTGLVHASSAPEERDLLLDAYLPAQGQAGEKLPAVILAFGGSFHRGDKGDARYYEDGAASSSMADYCRVLAQNGFACFSIDYRLTPEDPGLRTPVNEDNVLPKAVLADPAVTARIELIRERMGLPPFDDVTRGHLWNAIFAATEDMGTALNFVRENAEDYGIDPDRIAVGGFSAGAITAINLTYGARADVAAVVSLSGSTFGYTLDKTIREEDPPILMFVGQVDLPGILYGNSALSALFKAQGVKAEKAWVPGFGHFYPMGAVSLGPDFDKLSVEERMVTFLNETLK